MAELARDTSSHVHPHSSDLSACSLPGVLLACTFRLGPQWFGIDARWIQEVNSQTACTPIPHAPPTVRGYVNLRGHLRVVLELHELLGVERLATDTSPRLLVFKPAAGESFALLVDAVGDIEPIQPQQIDRPAERKSPNEEPASSAPRNTSLEIGLAKLEHQLVTLLDPRRFLTVAIR